MDTDTRSLLRICRQLSARAIKITKKRNARTLLGTNAIGQRSIRADVEIENMAIEELARARIGRVLVTEEKGEVGLGGKGEGVIVCDPLDGSDNFRLGVPFYCFAISFSRSRDYHDVYFSYVRDLAHWDEFYADEKFAYKNNKRIRASRETRFERLIVEVDENKRGHYADLLPLLSRVKDIRRIGANILGLCYLAMGATHLFIDLRGNLPAVHAPGLRIAQKAGALVTDRKGKPLKISLDINEKISFVASANRKIHEKALALMNG
ncbi:MAG: inositol monophosphatase family protein [Candidatus Micrarchaeota archaeon]